MPKNSSLASEDADDVHITNEVMEQPDLDNEDNEEEEDEEEIYLDEEEPNLDDEIHLDGEDDGADTDDEIEGDQIAAEGLDDDEPASPPVPGRSLADRLRTSLTARYGQLPVWLLLAQCFLTIGWFRAAIAHAVSPGWRNGAEVDAFRLGYQGLAIDWYREVVFDGLLGSRSGSIAIAVLIGQFTVVLALGLNRFVPVGLGIGAFLNVNFLLAGAIDPSTFYLVITAIVALWHIERSADPARSCWLTLISTVIGFTLIGALMPEIGTFHPASVVDDPAIVLSFITLLWIGALWLTFGRQVMALRPRRARPLTAADWLAHEAVDGPPPASDTVATIRLALGADPVEAWDASTVGSGSGTGPTQR